jgi:hypothetical protein
MIEELEELHRVAADGRVHDEAWREACAAVRKSRATEPSPEVAELLGMMSAITGWGRRVAELRRIFTANKHSSRRPPMPVTEQADQDLTAILHSMGLDDAPEGMRVPVGYAIRAGSVYCDDQLVSRRPIVVVGRCTDAETSDAQVTLAWWADTGWRTATVPRTTIADSRAIVHLALQDAPVDSQLARHVVDWLREQEHAADELPSGAALGRLGWLPDGSGFLLGVTPMGGRPIALVPPGDGERMHAQCYRVAGSADDWIKNVWPLVSGHLAAVPVLAAFAAPLLMPLKAPGFTVDLGGDTSAGKTTAAKAAASVYGGAGVLTPVPKTWAACRSGIAFRADLPTIYDDTKHLGGRWEIASQLVYAAADEVMQSLGAVGGGTRRAHTVRTILIITGESPLLAHMSDARGAMGRMISIGERLWSAEHVDTMRAVHVAIEDSYGAIGRDWIRYIAAKRELWPAWRKSYKAHAQKAAAEAPDDMSARLGQYLALLRVTATLLRGGLGLDVPDTVLADVSRLAAAGAVQRDVPMMAWEYMQGVASASPASWHGVMSPREPFYGVLLSDAVAWYPVRLREVLEAGGYEAAEVIASWKARGWLVCEKDRTTSRVTADSRSVHMVRVVHHDKAGVRCPGPKKG